MADPTWRVIIRPEFLEHEMALIRPIDLSVLFACAYFSRSNPACWPSNPLLQARTGREESPIGASLKALEKGGWIDRVCDRRDKQFRVILMLDRPDDNPCVESDVHLKDIIESIRLERLQITGIEPILYLTSDRPFPTPSDPSLISGIGYPGFSRQASRKNTSGIPENTSKASLKSGTESSSENYVRGSIRGRTNKVGNSASQETPPIPTPDNAKPANPQSDAKPNYRARSNWNSSLATVTAAVAYGVEHPLNGWSTTKEPQPEILAMLTEWAYGVPDRLKAAGLTLDPMKIVVHVAGQYYHTVWLEVCERLLTEHIAKKMSEAGQ